ncbi:MAG: LLM class flavin-dependent oxidoreductase [Gammaproteobacteria bacterium]|nr:LLM class flavin-dependent oxidoreductase [Gammaproteobacteria bacterium]
MKIGVFLQAQWDLAQSGSDLESELAALVRQAELAESLGFDSLWVPQHYVSAPYASLQPTPLLGLLAAHTRTLRLGTGVYLLPFTHPVVLAEDMASLDWITGGRLIFGAGMGYRDAEFEAMAVPRAERVGRFVEALEIIRRLWREPRVSHAGRHFTLNEVAISLKPKQVGGPPVWIGGGVSAAVHRAARIGDVWVSSMNPSFEELRGLYQVFDAARAEQAPAPERPTMRECLIADSEQAARATATPVLYAKYRSYQAWGVESSNTHVDDRANFEAQMAGKFLVGDRRSVAEQLRWLRDELGIDHLIARVRWPGLSEQAAAQTMRALAEVAAGL